MRERVDEEGYAHAVTDDEHGLAVARAAQVVHEGAHACEHVRARFRAHVLRQREEQFGVVGQPQFVVSPTVVLAEVAFEGDEGLFHTFFGVELQGLDIHVILPLQ